MDTEKRRCVPGKPISTAVLGRRAKRKISTGADVLPHLIDGRCNAAKHFKAIIAQVVADQGGTENISEIKKQLIQRLAGASVLAIQMEENILHAEPIVVEQYSALIGSIVRVANKLGIDRLPRNITPSLKDYLEQNAPTLDVVDAEVD